MKTESSATVRGLLMFEVAVSLLFVAALYPLMRTSGAACARGTCAEACADGRTARTAPPLSESTHAIRATAPPSWSGTQ